MLKEFNNLLELDKALPTDQSCIDYFRSIRWPNGAACHECGSVKVYTLAGEWHKCGDCGKKFSVRHDTIFADSKLPLRTWYRAIFLMTSHKKGISSAQLARDLGVMQKTAWHMLHRIREATMTDQFKEPFMSGAVPIQADETFIGGKEQFKHASKRSEFAVGRGSMYSKTMVFGMVQPGGELRLKRLPRMSRKEIEAIVIKNIKLGSKVYTDEATHYKWMHQQYEHSLVKHRMGEYVKGETTTNAIEGAFSHFKRSGGWGVS